MPDHDYVPLMFQAQVGGRSQIHKLEDLKKKAEKLGVRKETLTQQAYDWARQWQDACDEDNIPQFESHIQTRQYQFTWRMVTNSGQDAGVIRPVIGERGWAYFPGSSMKGAFLRACRQFCPVDEVLLFCGGKDKDGELHPGVLRFHGGYPNDAEWLDDSLVDVVHPQEDWQLDGQKNNGAFIQISLHQPTFVFGISSSKTLTSDQWELVWKVWQTALEQGIGSRVSAGYGQIATHSGNKLVSFGLSGEGQASKLIDGQGEFRPNLFKAALRGHTRRLFNGITDEATTDRITKLLWGGIGRGEDATVGLLGISFNAPDLELEEWRSPVNRNNVAPIYETGDAILDVLLMKPDLASEQRDELKQFIIRLMKFAMLLGGFGKSWRRAYHPHFLPNYERQMIGCHWEFTKRSHPLYIPFGEDLASITKFLDTFYGKGKELSWLQKLKPQDKQTPGIREAWHQDNVQVWGRLAEDEEDSLAIDWLHQPYKQGLSIKQSELTGKMGQIGRLWHRMYPRFRRDQTSDGKASWKPTTQYAELLTMFPNITGNEQEQEKVRNFLRFLDQETEFKRLW
jgi:CRISPR-associated protein Cmr6